MAIRFVLDEHLRGPLWRAVQRHNARAEDPIDVVRVGDPPDLPLGSDDAAVLAWAERERRILVTCDKNTIPRRRSSRRRHLGLKVLRSRPRKRRHLQRERGARYRPDLR